MIQTLAKLTRIDNEQLNRSDAMNRRLVTDAETIRDLKAHLAVTYTTIGILVLSLVTIGFGLK